jgi:hypothetical protein
MEHVQTDLEIQRYCLEHRLNRWKKFAAGGSNGKAFKGQAGPQSREQVRQQGRSSSKGEGSFSGFLTGWKKIRLPLFWLSKRPRMSGHWIQKSLGHVVHFCMLKIPLLSVPRLFYSISFVTYAGHRRFAALDRGCCGSALAGGNATLSLCRSARTIVLSVDSFG